MRYRFPDLRNGLTLHHITDTHFGAGNHAQFVRDWLDNTQEDLAWLSQSVNAGHVHTGDMIHWYDGAGNSQASADTETSWYVAWRDLVKADGLPFAEAVGNHDLLGPGPDGPDRPGRTSAEWAASIGVADKNMAHDMGDFKVLTVGPDTWRQGEMFVLSQPTLAWLDNQLQSAGKPCWIAAHVPFNEQFSPGVPGGGETSVTPGSPGVVNVIADNPNAIGWLSGHRHAAIRTNLKAANSFTVGGRRLFGVNGPAGGGGRRPGLSFDDHHWKGDNISQFVTYMGDAIDVRWRDHNGRKWISGPDGTHRIIRLNG